MNHQNMTIHLVKTRLVNSYVIAYPDQILVIDVAIHCHQHVLGFIQQELKRDIKDCKLVICTHDDPDHMGGVAAFAHETGAKIAIPYGSGSGWRKLVNDPMGRLTRLYTSALEITRPRAWDMYANPKRTQAAKQSAPSYFSPSTKKPYQNVRLEFSPQFRLLHGQALPMFPDWQVIHTPGHSWDSCCFYHSATHGLVTGDTLLGSGKQQRAVTAAIYSNKRSLMNTLKHLSTIEVQTVYPGHGSIIHGQNIINSVNIQ